MAFSHTGSVFAKPFTSFLVRPSRSPRINDIVYVLAVGCCSEEYEYRPRRSLAMCVRSLSIDQENIY